MHLRRMFHWLRPRVWSGWPEKIYQNTSYQQRLAGVQSQVAAFLDAAPLGPLRILNMCAGDGRDVIDAVSDHPRRGDVSAWFVELDRTSVDMGRDRAAQKGLGEAFHFINADATAYETYRGIGAVDLVLACGVWGHVPTPQKPSLVRAMAAFCKPGGSVIWTRGISRGMDKVHELEALFDEETWRKQQLMFTPNKAWAVATYRYDGPVITIPSEGQIFNFHRNAGLAASILLVGAGEGMEVMCEGGEAMLSAFGGAAEELCPTALLVAGRCLLQAMESGIV